MKLDSLDEVVPALYDCISGPAGPRDWAALAGLFLPGARLVRSVHEPDGRVAALSRSVDEFCKEADAYTSQHAFHEREVARQTLTYGQVAHVLSTYEVRSDALGPVTGRGINSIQLFFDGARWWVVSMVWDDDQPGQPLEVAAS